MKNKQLFLTDLKRNVDILTVTSKALELEKQDAVRYTAICPFHQDTTPSLNIYTDTNKYYCFTCGAKGDIVDFVQGFYKLDKRGAMEFIDNHFMQGHEIESKPQGRPSIPQQRPDVQPDKVGSVIPIKQVYDYLPNFSTSGLVEYAKIKGVFDLERLLNIAHLYRIGATTEIKQGTQNERINAITFSFYRLNTKNLNEYPTVANIEYIGYSKTGRRADVNHVRSVKGGRKGLGCIGLHLLHPKAGGFKEWQKINIVESGKTALLMQALQGQTEHVLNGTLWLATGGTNFLEQTLNTLKELDLLHLVSVIPDADAFTTWLNVCTAYGVNCVNVTDIGAVGKQDILDVMIKNVLTSKRKEAQPEQKTILRPHRHRRVIIGIRTAHNKRKSLKFSKP